MLLVLYLYGPRGDREPDVPGASGLRPRYALRRDVLWIAVVPVGLFAYLAYMQIHFGDWLAPYHAAQDYFHRNFDGPFSALWQGGEKAWDGVRDILGGDGPFGPAARKIALFLVACGALGACVGVIRRLPAAYGAFALISIVPALSFPYPPGPLASSLRYLVVVFPLFMWLGLRLTDRRAYIATVVAVRGHAGLLRGHVLHLALRRLRRRRMRLRRRAVKRRPAVGDSASSSWAAAFSIAAMRSGVSSPAFSASILASHSAPSAASASSSTTTVLRSAYLSISSNSTSTSWSCGTLRSGLPREKTRPSFLAPVIPKSACEASPMPLTAQPSTATSTGSS